MMNPARKKVFIFGSLGALGCLIGWGVGEGLLAAALLPARAGEANAAPSLASRPEAAPKPPEAPKLDRPAVVAPPKPDMPVLAKREAPQPLAPPGSQDPVVSKRDPPPPLPPDIQKRLDEAGGKSGQLQFTLIWNNRNDLDLHCIDPNDEEIFFSNNKAEKSGGHLDVDRNVNGETLKPIENIYFPSGAPLGRYRVYVNHYSLQGSRDPTAYTLNTLIEDRRLSFDGKLSSGDAKLLVHEFNLPGLRVAVSPEVIVYWGGKNTFRVRIERDRRNTDPVRLSFTGDTAGLKLPDVVTIPRNEVEAVVEVGADADAKVEVRKLRVVAEGKYGKAEAECKVAVQIPPAGLRLATPAEVVLFPGGKNIVRVRLERQHNDDPVRLSFVGESNGLKLPETLTVAGDRDAAEFEVAATLPSEAGTRKLRIVAEGKHGKVEENCSVIVRIPAATIQLAAPASIGVQPGGSNTLTVRIARDWFEGPVRVRCASVAGLTIWDATIPANRDGTELTLTALPEAKEGTFPLTLTATGGTATAEAKVAVEVFPLTPATTAAAPVSSWSWRLVLVIGGWTALLAIGLSLALVVGQNRYLARPWLSGRQAAVVLAGGGLAGLVAGAIGQTLFALVARSSVPPQIGFLAGWLLLGGLLGRGVCFFIPNLNAGRSTLGGVVGGLLGAIAFILVSKLGDIPGRFIGAVILGCCIGLMVALVELAFRKAWLEVRYGPREMITVNLGPEPVKIGSDSRECTIWARGAAPVAYRIWIREGKVVCENVATRHTEELGAGSRREAGAVELIVRTGQTAANPGETPRPRLRNPEPKPRTTPVEDDPFPLPMPAARPAETRAPPPKPIAPVAPARAASKPTVGAVCSQCGAKTAPGLRVCGICGEDLL